MINKVLNYNSYEKKRESLPQDFQVFKLPVPAVISTQKTEQTSTIGKRILKVSALTLGCFLLAFPNIPKKLRSKLDQANKNFSDKNIGNGNEKSIPFYVRELAKKVAKYSKAIFNLGPLKDVFIAKMLEKTRITNQISNSITHLFEQISVATVRRAYNKSSIKFNRFFAKCEKYKSKLPPEKLDFVNQNINQIKEVMENNFSEFAWRQRIVEIKNQFDGYDEKRTLGSFHKNLRDQVWDETYKNYKEFFNNKEKKYLSFISEKLVTDIKMSNAQKINAGKRQISNSLNSMCEDSFKLLMHIDTFIEPEDKAREYIKTIARRVLRIQKTVNMKNMHNNARFQQIDTKGFIESLKKLDESFTNGNKYDADILKEVSEDIKTLISNFETPKRGAINEIMKNFKDNLGENAPEYLELRKLAFEATKAFDKATDLEGDKLFDKIRDLKIGSAPKDVLVLVAPLIGVIYGLSKTKGSDEKVSVGVKYGIPIMGAVTTTLLCAIALISTGPSLIIGFLSGLALNQIGTGLDLSLKQHKAKNQTDWMKFN